MAQRTETLQLKITVDDSGKLSATLGNVAAGLDKVDGASLRAAKDLDGAAKRLDELRDRADPAGAAVRKLSADVDTLDAALKRNLITTKEANALIGKLQSQAAGGFGAAGGLGDTLGKLGLGVGLAEIATNGVKTIAMFQQLDAQLKTVTGSSGAAAREFVVLQKFAAQTPFQLQEVVTAFVKLKALGLDPSIEALRSYGNTASAMGKSLDQVIEAVADASTGEFERLKEFGIMARQTGDKVTFTFQGISTTVGKSAGEIEGYLRSIGETKFGNAMAEQSRTLAGAWSNLQDSAASLADAVGDAGLTGELTKVVKTLNEVVGAATAVARVAGDQAWLGKLITGADSLANKLSPVALVLSKIEPGIKALSESGNGPSSPAFELLAGGAQKAQATVEALFKSLEQGKQKAAAADASSNAEAVKYLETLGKEEAQIGKTRAEVTRMTAEQIAAGTADKNLAAAIRARGEAVAKAQEAQDREKQATKDATAAKKEHAAAVKQELDLLDAYMEGVKHMRDNVKEEEEQTRKQAEALAKLREAYERVLDQADPLGAKLRDIAKDEADVEKAYARGAITAEEYAKALELLNKERDKILQTGSSFNAAVGKVLGLDSAGAQQFIEGFTSELSDGIAAALKDGFKDAGKVFEGIFDNLTQNISRNIIQNKVVQPLQNYAQGGSFDGQTFGQGVAYVGASYGAGQLFGGGPRTQQGAQLGAAAGAAMGAAMGSVVPIIGTIIGAIIGAALGKAFEKKPRIFVRTGSGNRGDEENSGVGVFGKVGVTTMGGAGAAMDIVQAILKLDKTMASLLNPEEIAKVRDALNGQKDNYNKGAATPEQVLSDRLNEIIAAVEPSWSKFLGQFADVQERAEQFTALRELKKQLDDLDTTISNLGGDSLTQLRNALKGLDDGVTQARTALDAAFASMDPKQVLQAEQALQQAVLNRYQTEITMVRNLQDALESLDSQAYQLNVTIAQRIAGLTGDSTAVVGLQFDRIGALQGQVLNTSDAERGLQLINELIAATDQWLSSARAQIDANLQAQLAALDTERNAILASAQQRAQWAAAQQQAAAAAAQEAHQAAIKALEQQLKLAQDWVGVLKSAQDLIHALTTGASNPLDAQGRLDALNAQIGAAQSSFGAGSTAADADALLQLLNERLQLIQQTGLMQRPGDDYQSLYNSTLQQIAQIQGVAQPKADQAVLLQQQLDALNAAGAAISYGTGVSVQLSGEEQARLSAIEEEEKKLRDEAKKKLDDLNKEALSYYTWAQGKAQELEQQRHDELLAQLQELTGGLPVDEYIAQKQAQATELLTDIRDDIRQFLDSIGAGAGSPAATAPVSGSTGGSASTQGSVVGLQATVNVTVGGTGDPAAIGEAVGEHFRRNLPQYASQLKRELRTA